jgi:hypothetical protein
VEKIVLNQVEGWANDAIGKDDRGYRKEFLELLRKARSIPLKDDSNNKMEVRK